MGLDRPEDNYAGYSVSIPYILSGESIEPRGWLRQLFYRRSVGLG